MVAKKWPGRPRSQGTNLMKKFVQQPGTGNQLRLLAPPVLCLVLAKNTTNASGGDFQTIFKHFSVHESERRAGRAKIYPDESQFAPSVDAMCPPSALNTFGPIDEWFTHLQPFRHSGQTLKGRP